MSRAYEALKRAAALADRAAASAIEEPPADVRRVLEDAERIEFQQLRVWLMGSAGRGRPLKTLMVVGCHAGSGVTTTTASLTATLAHGKKLQVLAVDVNFRTPRLGPVFGVRNGEGLFDVMEEGLPLEAVMQPTDRPNLSVLTTGRVGRYPAAVFEGVAADRLLDDLRKRFDFVVLDAAPVLDFPDAYTLAPRMDGVLLVVQAERTSVEDAQRAKRTLEEAGARVLGAVVNRQRDYFPPRLKRLLGIAA